MTVTAWETDDDTELRNWCAHCRRPIHGEWVIEIAGSYFHSALHYRGSDRRRCRDVALKIQ